MEERGILFLVNERLILRMRKECELGGAGGWAGQSQLDEVGGAETNAEVKGAADLAEGDTTD